MSHRKDIAKAAGLVTGASVIVYGVSFLREIAVSMRFGVGVDLDVLLIAYAIPAFVGMTISGVVQAVLVPLYSEIRETDPTGLGSFIDRVFTMLVLILVGIMALLYAVAPELIRLFNRGLGDPQIALARRLVFCLLPVIPCMGLSGLMIGILYAERNFWWPTILPATTALVVAVCVWAESRWLGIYSMAVGTSIGFAVQLTGAAILLKRQGIVCHVKSMLQDARVRRLLSLSWPVLIGAASTGTITIIDRAMASMLPAGSISALSYAERINGIALVALGSIQTAAFPFLAAHAGRKDHRQLTIDFRQTMAMVCFLLAPASVALVAYNRPLIGILFQRGAFDAAATEATGRALVGYAVGLLPVGVGLLAGRTTLALQNARLIGFQGMLNPVLKVSFNLLLIPLLAHAGIAFATTGMYTVGATIMLVAVLRRLHVRTRASHFVPFLKMGAGLIAMIGALRLVGLATGALGSQGKWGGGLVMIFGTLAGLATYGAICWMLRVEEARLVVSTLRRLARRVVSHEGSESGPASADRELP